MQLLPQALPLRQILQQFWASSMSEPASPDSDVDVAQVALSALNKVGDSIFGVGGGAEFCIIVCC